MAAVAAYLPMALTAAGTIIGAKGALAAGKAQQQAAEFQATQLEQQAGQSIAASQRAAAEQRRTGRFVQSRAQALAASSGAGASDPTVVKIMSDLEGEGAYRALLALHEGDSRARIARLQAAGARYGGQVARQVGKTQALSTLLKGGSSLFSKYGATTKGNPSTNQFGMDDLYEF